MGMAVMNRRGVWFAVVLLCAGWLGIPSRSYAYSRNFTIFNDTTGVINSVWTSAFGDKYWHRVTGLANLAPGQQSSVTFNRPGPCIIQLRVTIDGVNHDWTNGFNLCSVSHITIYYNTSTRNFTARYH